MKYYGKFEVLIRKIRRNSEKYLNKRKVPQQNHSENV